MIIVNLDAFLTLPEGTLYSKYEPCNFQGLMIKGENCGSIDFWYQDLIGELDSESTEDFVDKCALAEKGKTVKFDLNCQGRDGLFERGQLFAIYDGDDVGQLLNRIENAIAHK